MDCLIFPMDFSSISSIFPSAGHGGYGHLSLGLLGRFAGAVPFELQEPWLYECLVRDSNYSNLVRYNVHECL